MAGEHSRSGASAVRCGGDTAYRRGTGNRKSQTPNSEEPREFMSASSRRLIPQNWIEDEHTVDTPFSILAVGLRDDGSADPKEILSDQCARNRGGHHFLLGRAHDHRRARIQARGNPARLKTTFRSITFSSPALFVTARAANVEITPPGNSPDPLELIDKYGADGLRFGLMRIAPTGQDIRFDERQIEEGRNFATKLWNVARFRQMHGSASVPLAPKPEAGALYRSMPSKCSRG